MRNIDCEAVGKGSRSQRTLGGSGKVLGFYSDCDGKLWEGFEHGYDMMKLLKKITLAVALRID